MTRTRESAKKAGTAFETSIVGFLAAAIGDDRIERRRLSGAKDRGDVTGLRVHGQRVVVECKDYAGRVQVGPWLNEVEVERGNDDALLGVVVAKRSGTANPADQLVAMTLADFAALITGTRVDR